LRVHGLQRNCYCPKVQGTRNSAAANFLSGRLRCSARHRGSLEGPCVGTPLLNLILCRMWQRPVISESLGEIAAVEPSAARHLAARDPETARSDRLRMTKRGFVEVKRYLSEYWKPLHGMGLGEVTRSHVTNRIDELAVEKGAITADRARTALSGLYSWNLQGDDKLSNPIMGSRRHGDNDPRERVLSDAELVAVWNASDPATDYGRIVRLLLLTACRRDEIAGLRWSEIHALEMPGAAEIRYIVPLSAPAVAILPGTVFTRGREHVFGRGAGGFGGYSRSKAALDAKAALAEHWVLHDLRRTVRTRVGSLGVQPHIGEAILNHLPPQLMRIYDRNAYETEKRAALDRWATCLQTILASADGANVVPSMRRCGNVIEQLGNHLAAHRVNDELLARCFSEEFRVLHRRVETSQRASLREPRRTR
jgi:integrase